MGMLAEPVACEWRAGWRVVRFAALLLTCLAAHPSLADSGAITLEGGGTLRYGEMAPSIGTGDPVDGSLAGAWGAVRYGLTNRIELQLSGFWEAPATFVQSRVAVATGSGSVTGALTQDVTRWGAAAGARYVVAGLVWRVPVGLEVGWMHAQVTHRDLLDTSDPQAPSSLGLKLGDDTTNQLFVAPSIGVEWLVTDHLRLSVVPRLQVVLGGQYTLSVVVPVTVGWSWYLF